VLKARVIPSILTDGVSQVKGESFNSWRTVGSVVAAAKVFDRRDVDELVLLDVSARSQQRVVDPFLVLSIADFLRVPFAVGGGINSIKEIESLLSAGADKVIIGSSSVENPKLVTEAANSFGSQAVVCSVDYLKEGDRYLIATESGKKQIDLHPVELAIRCEELGAGEILLQNILQDGSMKGVDTYIVKQVSESVELPVIASGGVSGAADFASLLDSGASSVAAGAIFQFTQTTPRDVRKFLGENGYPVRRF
jgi:cyclase